MQEEKIVATLGTGESPVMESELRESAKGVQQRALSFTITNDEEYRAASDFARDAATTEKNITEYWKPIKDGARNHLDLLRSREKDMLGPVADAKEIMRQKLSAYQTEIRNRQRMEEEARRAALEEEARQRLKEAETLEASGKRDEAASALVEAEVAEQAAAFPAQTVSTPRAEGTHTRKGYEVVVTDESKVPVSFNGAVFRPVDLAAIKRYVKATGGNVEIPGVSIKETHDVVIRRR